MTWTFRDIGIFEWMAGCMIIMDEPSSDLDEDPSSLVTLGRLL